MSDSEPENIFQTPGAELEGGNEPPRPGSLWKGILLGGVADLGGTMAVSTIVFFIYIWGAFQPGMSPEEVQKLGEQFSQDLTSFDNVWSIVMTLFGSSFSVLGGYVCAFFAREKWKKAVLILAAIMAGYGLLAGGDSSYQFGELLALTLLSVALMYFGGWLRGRRHSSN
ncbi:MAG: hypothetical protein PVG20_04145 [Thioalkalispiraceae bacterium]|jgi:hypothetical protein